jgi:hypothetical protein
MSWSNSPVIASAAATAAPSSPAMAADSAAVRSLGEKLVAAAVMALVFAILDLVAFLAAVILALLGFGFGGVGGFVLVGFAVNALLFVEVGRIQAAVGAGRYFKARHALRPWIVLGFIFGWIVVGVLLLVAYRGFAWVPLPAPIHPPTPGPAPAPAISPPAIAAPPLASPGTLPMSATSGTIASPPSLAPPCPRCGRPVTWVPQYQRWFCYAESQYL